MSDRSEVFPSATCALKDCISFWSLWCRGCNLVYCGAHIKTHNCKPEDRAAREALYLSDLTETQDPVEDVQPCPPQP